MKSVEDSVREQPLQRAIAIKPKVLILDEATSALDVTVQKEILELLERLREERKMSYLFICHVLHWFKTSATECL